MKFHFAAVGIISNYYLRVSWKSGTSMMRLHPLQRMREEASSLHVQRPILRNDSSFHLTSGPEAMPHRTPGIFRIRAKITLAILAHVKSGSSSRDGQIHYTGLVGGRFDRIGCCILVECDGAAICVEGELLVAKVRIAEGIGRP